VNIVSVGQSGLGLPDRDYYLRPEPRMATLRQAYQGYVARLLTLAKQPDAEGAAARIVALETRMAQRHWDRARSRDRNATYNKMTVAELQALTPSYAWASYLKGAGLERATDVVVRQPDYVRAVDTLLTTTPAGTWREYLTFKLLDGYADELPAAFGQARFDFRGRTLAGQTAPPAAGSAPPTRWGAASARPWASSTSIATSSPRRRRAWTRWCATSRGVSHRDRLARLDEPRDEGAGEGQAHPLHRQDRLPDKWRDYSALDIRRGDLLGNAMRANAFQYAYVIDQLGKPVDRGAGG
jgi:predicted metalloendopeptidase